MPDQIVASRKTPAHEVIKASFFKPVAALLVSTIFFTNNTGHTLQVLAVTERHATAETTAGTLTLTVVKAASGIAVASGTAVHASTVNLKGTANTNASPTLSATMTDYQLADGDSLGAIFNAAGTEIAGVVITVLLTPIS